LVFLVSFVVRLSFIALLIAAAASRALAGAPQPAKAVSAALYAGRWYEIARTPNARQKNCQGDTSDFSPLGGAAFTVVETCHEGSPAGPARSLRTRARVVPGSRGAKFAMSFLGGLIRQQYWILDHADDDAWALMATPGGHYIWLLARQPILEGAARAAALTRLSALGYNPARLIFPPQQGH
jgi:apolipoprotein D and lipocalin family protein